MPGRLYSPINLPPLIITTVVLPNASLGNAYSTTLSASGGVGGYTWSLLSNVPNTGSWLSISAGGVLSGTPGTAETEIILVQVQDVNGTKASAFFTLSVVGLPLTIATSSPLPPATAGTAYSVTLTATGGTPGYTWSLVSASPNTGAWIAVSSGGILSGTPSTAETESITIRVQDSLGTVVTKTFSLSVAAAATLSFPRVMLIGVGGDQGFGRSSGYPWTTAAGGTSANTAIQTIAAYDIAVLAGTFEGWDSSGTYDRDNFAQALHKNGSYTVTKSATRDTLVFWYGMATFTVNGNPYAQWQAQVDANNWYLYESTGGVGTRTPGWINNSAAWPTAIGSAGIGASICGRNYGTTSNGSPTGAQGPARTFGNYSAIKLLMRGYTGDSRFSFNVQMGSPSSAGIFLDCTFVALDGAGNVPDSSLDGISLAPGSQQGGGFPGLDTVQPVMARGFHNLFDQMQIMLTTYGTPGNTYYNFANFGQFANKYQFGTATLTAGLESTLHGGLLENVLGAGAISWECFQVGNPNTGNTTYASGWPNLKDNYYQAMDFCLAPKLVGVGAKLPSADGTITASWPVGASTTPVTVTAGTAAEYQLMRYGLCTTLLDDGYWAPGCTGYDWSKPRWYDEYGDDSLAQVNVKRGYLGTPLSTRPTSATWAQGTMGVWSRRFSNGIAIVNPRGNGSQTVTLPQQYQALTGTQQPTVNNGALVTTVTIPDGDGRIYIQPASGPPLLFFDNFASGNLSHTQSGVSWGGSTRTAVINNPTGQTPPNGASAKVLQFTFDVNSESEQRYQLGVPYNEIIIQWDIWYPLGFVDGTGSPTNNKACRIWHGDTTDANDGYGSFYIKAGASTTKGSAPNICHLIQEYGSNLNGSGVGEFGNNNPPQPGPPFTDAGNYNPWITSSDLGTWVTWKFRFKCSSAANNDGVIETWKNGTKVISATNLPFYPNSAAQNGFTFGNILGFANTGYATTVLLYVTNVSIWGQ